LGALGCFAVNQTFEWYYKAEFLKTPCELCEDLNPHLKLCPKLSEAYPSMLEKEYKNITIIP